jgi:hypothetical protein
MRKLILVSFLATACSGNNSPMAPSSPYPDVAGTYSGTITGANAVAGVLFVCPAHTTITQSGANISIGPLMLGGSCAAEGFVSLPVGDGTIATTGSLGNATLNNLYAAFCNGYYNAVWSGGFFGSSFQFSAVYTPQTPSCAFNPGTLTASGTLTR